MKNFDEEQDVSTRVSMEVEGSIIKTNKIMKTKIVSTRVSMEVEGSEDKELLLKDLCASQPVFQWRLKDHHVNAKIFAIESLNPCFNGG